MYVCVHVRCHLAEGMMVFPKLFFQVTCIDLPDARNPDRDPHPRAIYSGKHYGWETARRNHPVREEARVGAGLELTAAGFAGA